MVDDDKKATTIERRNMKTEKFRNFFSAELIKREKKRNSERKIIPACWAFSVEMESMGKRKLQPQGAGESEQTESREQT